MQRLRVVDALDDEYAIGGRVVASYGFFEGHSRCAATSSFCLIRSWNRSLPTPYRLADCYGAMIDRFLEIVGARLDRI